MADFRNALKQFLVAASPEAEMEKQQVQQNALALQSGQMDMQNKLSQQDLEHIKFGGQLAQALKAAPADQRPAIYSQYAPILKRRPDFDANDEALFQTDQGLDQIINSSKFLTPAEKPISVAPGGALVNPRTMQELYRAPDKPNNYEAENRLREMQIRQQGQLTRAQIDATNAYRQGNQDLQQQQMQATADYRNLSQLMQQQKMQQDQANANRSYDLSSRRLQSQDAQQQAQVNKATVAKNKTLLPYSEAIASIQNTMDAANKLIFDPNRPGKVDPAFSGATGAIDKYTGVLGEMMGTKEGVKSRDIERFVNSKIIPLAESLKPLSNSDIAFVKTTFPSKGSSVKTWLSWYQNELPSIMKLAQDKMDAAASAYDVTAPAGVYEGSNIPPAQNTAPKAPPRAGQLQQFRSSTGINFEVQ